MPPIHGDIQGLEGGLPVGGRRLVGLVLAVSWLTYIIREDDQDHPALHMPTHYCPSHIHSQEVPASFLTHHTYPAGEVQNACFTDTSHPPPTPERQKSPFLQSPRHFTNRGSVKPVTRDLAPERCLNVMTLCRNRASQAECTSLFLF